VNRSMTVYFQFNLMILRSPHQYGRAGIWNNPGLWHSHGSCSKGTVLGVVQPQHPRRLRHRECSQVTPAPRDCSSPRAGRGGPVNGRPTERVQRVASPAYSAADSQPVKCPTIAPSAAASSAETAAAKYRTAEEPVQGEDDQVPGWHAAFAVDACRRGFDCGCQQSARVC